jgi:signal transduction histidine kinase
MLLGSTFRSSFLPPVISLLLGVPVQVLGSEIKSGLHSALYAVEHWPLAGSVVEIAQDKEGYLWVATSSGLFRFDGAQFTMWGTGSEQPLPSDAIGALLASKDGSIWIGFNGVGGVSRVMNGQSRHYSKESGLSGGSTWALIEDDHGILWAGGRAGLARLHDNQWEYLREDHGLPHQAVHGLYEDRSGALWVGTSVGIFRRTATSNNFERMATHVVHHFSEGAPGDIWATAQSGELIAFTHGGIRIENSCNTRGLTSLHDRDGNLWMGTADHGVLRAIMDPHTGDLRCTPVKGPYEGPVTRVRTLFQDAEDNIWAGTERGILRIFKSDVLTLTNLQASSGRSVITDGGTRFSAVEATADGSVWLGTDHGLTRMTGVNGLAGVARQELRGHAVTALREKRPGELWVATRKHVGVFANGIFSRSIPVSDAGVTLVFTMASDAHGTAWLCHGNDTGVYRVVHGQLTLFGADPNIRSRSCSAVYGDRHGRIWIGFEDGSIAIRDEQGVQFYPSVAPGRVNAFYYDDRGAVWIASNFGLTRFHHARSVTVSDQNGLPARSASAIIEDNTGYLWVAFANSIIRLTREEFDKAASDASYQLQYIMYNSADGLIDAPSSFGAPKAARGADGRLWFSTSRGVVAIDPLRVRPKTAITRIERVQVDEQTFVPQALALPSRTSNIEITYSALSLSAGSKVRFQYMLKDIDATWVHAGSRRQAFYTKLPPGGYQFLVRGTVDGSQTDAQWTFSITPPFYQTTWFYISCLAAAAIVVGGMWQVRLRALRRQLAIVLEERARIGRELHDTVLQSMAATALDLEALARQAHVSPMATTHELRRVRKEVESHIVEARQSIYDLRCTRIETRTLAEVIQESAAELLANETTCFDVTVEGEPRPCRHEAKEQLLRIAKEAIRNAINHGKARNINIRLTYDRDAVRLRVLDDGCGFNADVPGGGPRWGLMGMRERSKRIGGCFILRSAPGSGTEVDVVINDRRAT